MAPLSGITVIEAGSYVAIPFAGQLLADLGADVIKIERPGGDPYRGGGADNYRASFRAVNRSKKSVIIDIGKPEGKQIFRKLGAKADVVIENNRAGYMDKLGLGFEELSKLNARLVYCSVTGFGTSGPYRDRPSFDTVGQAMSGLLSLYLDPESPRLAGAAIADQVTAMYACYGTLAGLMQRERTGRGCRVETSMLAAGLSFSEMWFTSYKSDKVVPGMYERSSASQSFAFRASDAKLLVVHLSSRPKFWESLLVALEAPHLAGDPRFSARPERVRNYEALRDELASIVGRRPRSHWMTVLADNGVPFAPVYSFDELESDPQVQHMDLFQELKHPGAEPTAMVKRPVRIDGDTGSSQAFAPPLMGEHTNEVLKEFGYAEAELDALEKSEVIKRRT